MSKRSNSRDQTHAISGLFSFALFSIFVVLSLLLVVIGVDGYRKVVARSESIDGIRTTLGYIAGKVNSDACADGIMLTQIDGLDVLELTRLDDDGEALKLCIYYQNGALYEFFYNAEEMDFDPEFGDKLVDISSLEMDTLSDKLIGLTVISPDGRSETLHVAMRSVKEVTQR